VNNKQKEIHNINDLEEKNVNKFLTNSYLDDSKNQRLGGRKKKEKKTKELMATYLTTEQKEKALIYCEKKGLPFSTMVRQLLIEKGIL
jgi:hypothetical protein